MKVVILAGGKGSRMGELVSHLPKPMVPLAGKPIMEHQIDLAKRYGLEDFLVLTGYKADVLEAHFGDGDAWGVRITYVRDDHPLGTAGAVKRLEHRIEEPFFVFYGDVLMDVHLPRLSDYHRALGAAATIAVHPNDHPFDSDLVEVDSEDRVLAIHNKPHDTDIPRRNLVSAALYVLSPEVFEHIEEGRPSDFGRDVFPRLIASGEAITAYQTREYIKDVGTARRLSEVESDMFVGRPSAFNHQHPVSAIFLDRDGVLNYPVEPLRSADELRLLPGVAVAVGKINRSERLAVVTTNQPLVAKGFALEKDLELIHGRMEGLLSDVGAYVDRIYYCPHHPESGHPGERPELKIRCSCRKPGTGMIDRATRELNIDLSDSFVIGDRTADVKAGIDAGIGTILVRTGCAGEDDTYRCDPDFIFPDLGAAVDFLESDYPVVMTHVERIVSDLVGDRRVIAIGGLSRSGKTILAGATSLFLRRRGVEVKRMCLDDWLLGLHERTPEMTVAERYSYPAINDTLRRVIDGECVEFERYDAVAREGEGGTRSLTLDDGEMLIVEGVVSLDLPEVRDVAASCIYTEVDESVRRTRMLDFYLSKGLSEKEIGSLQERRRWDEERLVVATKKFADSVVDIGKFL